MKNFLPEFSPDEEDIGSTPGGMYGVAGGSGKGEFGSRVGSKWDRFSGK